VSKAATKRLARAVDRARLAAIRLKLRTLRRARPVRLREIREACRVGRENVRARAKALQDSTRAALRASVLAMRQAERGTCEKTKAKTKEDFATKIGAASHELGFERGYYQREHGRGTRGSVTRSTAKERREESDDAVRRNLPPELVPVFNRVRTTIKATPRMSRTEHFLQWVHDNPDEAHSIVYDAIERDVERMIHEQSEIEKRLRKGHSGDAALDALASDVPF
jgi:hypothetical protein